MLKNKKRLVFYAVSAFIIVSLIVNIFVYLKLNKSLGNSYNSSFIDNIQALTQVFNTKPIETIQNINEHSKQLGN